MVDASDRVAGILLGLAAGDRNGGPVRMALRVSESLVECGTFDLEDIAARYLAWWREGAVDTGPTAAEVFALVDSGLSFAAAAQQVHVASQGQTAGCNPAHRSAPLAMSSALKIDDLTHFAMQEAALTHAHPLAGDVAAAVVAICGALVRGASWEDAVAAALVDRLPPTRAALASSPVIPLRRGGFAPDVLAAAVHFVGANDCFESALNASLQFAGPANYCPVLVGSLGGARWGAGAIGLHLLEHCNLLPRIQSVAIELASHWQ